MNEYLATGRYINSSHPAIQAFSRENASGSSERERAVSLYYAVRDKIRYNPFLDFADPDVFRASAVLEAGQGFCVGKASLLAACGSGGDDASATVDRYLRAWNRRDYTAMAKLVATETAVFCADRAVQILGGDGLAKEYGKAEQLYRDARALPIVGGTSEMARYLIAAADLPDIKPNL